MLLQIFSFNRNVRLYLFFTLLSYTVMGATNVLYGLYIMELGFSEDLYGNLMAIKTVAVGLSAIPCSMICIKLGYVKTLRLTVLINVVASLLLFTTVKKVVLFLGALISGVALALIFVIEGPFLMKNSLPENRIRVFSYNFTILMASSMAGSFLSGAISDYLNLYCERYISMRLCLLFFTFISSLAVIPVTLMMPDNQTVNKESLLRSHFTFLIRKLHTCMWGMLVSAGLIGLGAGMVIPFFNIFLKYKLGVENYELGIIMSASQMAIMLGSMFVPYLAGRLGKINTIILCQMLSIPFLLLIATPPNVYLVSCAFLLRNCLMNMAYPLIQNVAMEQTEESLRPLYTSLLKVTDNLSRGVGSFIGGWLMVRIGYEFPYYITALLYFCAAALFAYYFRFKPSNYVEDIM